MPKAVGLLSGGLDSTLAARMMLDQGIEVHAINFVSPFCNCTPKSAGCSAVATAIRQLGDIPLKTIALTDEYLEIVQHPKHGHGKNLNPCIDCRILKIKKAAEYMREIGADFLFTGEVLGQRPMSQHRIAFNKINTDSEVGDLILRPLSAALMEPTKPERDGIVDRTKLLAINGRGRSVQMAMADDADIKDYHCAAGGCLLTDANFCDRLRDYLDHTETPMVKDISRLKSGRHIRLSKTSKLIIAKNAEQGEFLLRIVRESDVFITVEGVGGPVAILEGEDVDEALAAVRFFIKKDVPASACFVLKTGGVEKRIQAREWPEEREFHILGSEEMANSRKGSE